MAHYKGLISCPIKEEAEKILAILLEQKLAAGGFITDGISNHWWQGKIDKEPYWNISIFTIKKHFDKIINIVEKESTDDTPGVTFYKIDYGNKKFLDWITLNT